MATVQSSSAWADLFGPRPSPADVRVLNAGIRNEVVTVGDVLACCAGEVLLWRNVGESLLQRLEVRLAEHGLQLAQDHPVPCLAWRHETPASVAPPPRGDVLVWAERADWIGRQLVTLSGDNRVAAKNGLGGRWAGAGDELLNRRRAWAWYRWGTTPDADWPRDVDGGFGFMAIPLPGSIDLHLEGLNRLAREELGDE